MSVNITVTGDVDVTSWLAEDAEKLITDIYVDLTSPPPIGTPVDTGEARNGWQLDLSNRLAPEVYNPVVYILRLNDGLSNQTPPGFIEAAVDKNVNK